MTQIEMSRPQRVLVGAVMPSALVLFLVVPYLLLRTGLPDPMAVRFSDRRATDGVPIGLYLIVVGGVVTASAAVLVTAARRPHSLRGIEAAVASFLGWTVAITHVWVLMANDGEESWRETTLAGGTSIGAAGGALGLSLPIIIMMRRSRDPNAKTGDGFAFDPGERVAWFGSSTSRVLAGAALATTSTGAAAILGMWATLDVGLVMVLTGFLIAQFMRIDVTIRDDGVTLRAGLLRWPRWHYPLSEIRSARAIATHALRWGGWGYRGTQWLLGRAAWVLRSGPALDLARVNGRHLAITIDGAEEAAAVINGLLARADSS